MVTIKRTDGSWTIFTATRIAQALQERVDEARHTLPLMAANAIPFSRDEFLQVFESYNRALWPGQVFLYLVAFACVVLVLLDRSWARRTVAAMLGGLWLWMGVAYHWMHFTRINPAAWIFGGLFVVQASLFFVAALRERGRATAEPLSRSLGGLLLGYALIAYPLLGALSDHAYPRAPTFGLPCPTTIFTFGVLLLASQHVSWWLIVIPALWAAVGATATFQFGIWEDVGLLLAAFVSVAVLIAKRSAVHQLERNTASSSAAA
jgi:hypothetical protein